MSELDDALERLASSFAARDIMVPEHLLVAGIDEASARELLDSHPEFDVIPIERDGTLHAYLKRDSSGKKTIGLKHVVSDATPILDLVETLSTRGFCFVLHKNRVVGFINFSDLNRSVVKLPFFVLLQALEQRIIEHVQHPVSEEDLANVIGPEAARRIARKHRKQRKRGTDLGLLDALGFADTVKFARHDGIVTMKNAEFEDLKWARNRVCHANLPLIESRNDAQRLYRAARVCLAILGG